MPVTEQWLRERGYRQVRSELHAYQLIRWWLKYLAKNQQRQRPERCMFDLLAITPGAWFKLFRGHRGYKAVLIWREEVLPSGTREADEA